MDTATPQLHGTKAVLPYSEHPKYCWCPGEGGMGSGGRFLLPTELRSERQMSHTRVEMALLTLTQSLFSFHSLSQEETPQQLFFSLPPEDKKATPNCFQASVLWILQFTLREEAVELQE